MIRLLLILLIVILIARIFIIYSSGDNNENRKPGKDEGKNKPHKGVPKDIGDYVDYEEVKKI
jgi:hypothetical protein